MCVREADTSYDAAGCEFNDHKLTIYVKSRAFKQKYSLVLLFYPI